MESFAAELVRVQAVLSQHLRSFYASYELSPQQGQLLLQLREGGRDVSTLAELGGRSLSAMTRLIDGLNGLGLLERQRDVQDRRRVLISLTSAGRSLADSIHAAQVASLVEVFERLPKRLQTQSLDALRAIREALASSFSD